MSQTILSQMLNELQFLEPVELQQLNYAVQERLNDKEQAAKQVVFHQALVDCGLVRKIKEVSHQPIVRQTIQVKGKPISETLLEERR